MNYNSDVQTYQDGTPAGPYVMGPGKSRLAPSASYGFACAADSFAPDLDGSDGATWWGSSGMPGTVYSHYINGSILGFNVLYFDGSVKWWNNINNVLVNQGDAHAGNDYSGPVDNFWQAVQQNNTAKTSL
jgi:prepilin-type processing-associated H-X9-DG protein